jgi:hypothetical protein
MRGLGLAISMALAVCTPAASLAQDDASAQLLGGEGGHFEVAATRAVASELDRAGSGLGSRYAPLGEDAISLIGVGEPGHREIYHLEAHHDYLFQAVCDRACEGLALEVRDPAGAIVSDAAAQPWPVAVVAPRETGYYAVIVRLSACGTDYCYAGIRGYDRLS